MSANNRKKAIQLGMPHGTASNRLRKMILFSLVQRLELDICFQCDQPIAVIEDLSIEHKMPWQDSEDPPKLFFDLDNISFSHIRCNIGTKRYIPAPVATLICHKCGKEFTRKESHVRKNQKERISKQEKFYCSTKCSGCLPNKSE